ncbi:MAG: hypothetical protein AAF298_05535 [Cyanobacteria bacterium P01_A01_bin.40]
MASDKIIWKQLIYKTGIWVTVEIWLNLIGLDDIADYGEFIFAQDLALKKKNRRTVQVIEYPPQFCQQINDYCPLPGTVTKPQDLEHHSCKSKAETFKNKCQQLTEPCVKVVCLTTNSEVN